MKYLSTAIVDSESAKRHFVDGIFNKLDAVIRYRPLRNLT